MLVGRFLVGEVVGWQVVGTPVGGWRSVVGLAVGTGLSFGLVFGAHEPGARPALKVHEHLVRGTGTGTGIGRARHW